MRKTFLSIVAAGALLVAGCAAQVAPAPVQPSVHDFLAYSCPHQAATLKQPLPGINPMSAAVGLGLLCGTITMHAHK